MNGSQQDFNQDYNAYKEGFGSLMGNYWMGLDPIYYLASPDRNNNTEYVQSADRSERLRWKQ